MPIEVLKYPKIASHGSNPPSVDNSASTISVAQIKVVVNGTPNAFGVRFTDVYAKRNGSWQMVTWQSTRLPA